MSYNPERAVDYTNTDPNYWSGVNEYFKNDELQYDYDEIMYYVNDNQYGFTSSYYANLDLDLENNTIVAQHIVQHDKPDKLEYIKKIYDTDSFVENILDEEYLNYVDKYREFNITMNIKFHILFCAVKIGSLDGDVYKGLSNGDKWR